MPMKKGLSMFREIFTVAGGNTTLLVEGCAVDQRLDLAKGALQEVEQVGFIDTKAKTPSLEMMGREFSVNGTIAFANKLGGQGQLITSGLDQLVTYYQDKGRTNVKLKLPFETFPERLGQVVRFQGIGYLCTDKLEVPSESLVRDLCNKYNLPAFGLAMYFGDKISPFVYVRETDSLIPETACGSGSIAVSIITGRNDIIQPTLQRISVFRTRRDQFTISAKAKRLRQINKPAGQKPALESTIA